MALQLIASSESWWTWLSGNAIPAFFVVGLLTLCVVGFGLNLLGLPGNWVILLTAFGFDFLLNDGSRLLMGRKILLVLLLLAVAGEVLELFSGIWGTARIGGSQRGAWGALIGSLIGGMAGAVLGIPIPILGPVVGLVFLAAIGALIGAAWAEYTLGRDLRQSLEIGIGAMLGRVAGTAAKLVMGVLMLGVVALGLIIQ